MSNKTNGSAGHAHPVTFAALLITLGIVYGDIGTSPLYTIKAIIGSNVLDEVLILGAVSCVFWTLTILTTGKYVLICLRADNNGEGGILPLFTLVRRFNKWLFLPAIIGAAFLLADGIITAPITVSSAVEGLSSQYPGLPVLPIIIIILALVFLFQQFGTQTIGKTYGPIMLLWFTMISLLGIAAVVKNPQVFKALNPWYAYELLTKHHEGFWLLGSVFLCTTGAEALYADLGHTGRANIQITWAFVKLSLLLSYFGQAAFLLEHVGEKFTPDSVFYSLVPDWFLIPSVIIATLASIVASQALVSGAFNLVNEAIRLEIAPRLRVVNPTELRGQLYIPAVNWFLFAACIFVMLYFEKSANMEAAYGLTVTVTMLMTTVLLFFFLRRLRIPVAVAYGIVILLVLIEGSFLVANLKKFTHGGWFSFLMGSIMVFVMWVWYQARQIKNRLISLVPLKEWLPVLSELSNDKQVPKFSTHLVYLSWSKDPNLIDRRIIYSILNRQPKRADIYWFVNIEVVDEPYRMSYTVKTLVPDDVVFVQFHLGFRVEPRINLFFRKVVESMVRNKEVDITSRYESLGRFGITGDFHFILLQSFLSYENDLPPLEKFIMRAYYLLSHMSLNDARSYGLDTSSVTVEKVPLLISAPAEIKLAREFS